MRVYSEQKRGKIILGDSLGYMPSLPAESVDLVVTSPPYPLTAGKKFWNPTPGEYIDWFMPFGGEVFRILKPTGSFILNVGSVWNKGIPTRSLYQHKLLIRLCDDTGFHLAQELFNYKTNLGNAEWVNIRRVRVKTYIENVFWLSKTEWPKADNRNVLVPYGDSMVDFLKTGRKKHQNTSPTGRTISKTLEDNGGGISSDVIATPNTDSNSNSIYHAKCKEAGYERHGARFPPLFAEFFIRFLTDEGDMVLDPFAGSCSTGEAAEATRREWVCVEKEERYLQGALFRFPPSYHRKVDPEGGTYGINKIGYKYHYGKALPGL